MSQSRTKRLSKSLTKLNELKRVIYRDLQDNQIHIESAKRAIVDVYFVLGELEEIYGVDLTLQNNNNNAEVLCNEKSV